VGSQGVRLTLETVTPLLLGGVDPRGRPELRPPAFRGVLRYWLRAAAGGVVGDGNLVGLHRIERAVFGDTTSASAIALRLEPAQGGLTIGPQPILPHHADTAARRPAFQAGQHFALRVHRRPGASEQVWRVACATAELALTCGGVGLRSRRGYGTLRIAASSDPILVPTFPVSMKDWVRHVERVAVAAVASLRELALGLSVPVVPLPAGPSVYPCANKQGLLRIVRIDGAETAMTAVAAFMKQVPKHPAFGGINPRQASPLWVRPLPLGTEQYGLLFTVLASRLARGSEDYEAVRQFLLKNFPDGEDLRVPGWNE
jgi:CRISPR-associated protein Cmr1